MAGPIPSAKLREASHRLVRYALLAVGSLVLLVVGLVGLHYALVRFHIAAPSQEQYVLLGFAILISLAIIQLLGRVVQIYVVPRTSPAAGSILRLLFNVLAYVALVFLVLEYLGVNVEGALVGAGFLGIVLGLAAQTVIGNFLGAMAILAARPFLVGDRITVVLSTFPVQWESYNHETQPVGYTGRVREIGLIYTELEGDEGLVHFVPNGQLVQSLLLNHSRGESRRVRVRVVVPRSLPFAEYEKAARASLQGVEGLGVEDFELRLVALGTEDYHVVVVVNFRTSDPEGARSAVLRRLESIPKSFAAKP